MVGGSCCAYAEGAYTSYQRLAGDDFRDIMHGGGGFKRVCWSFAWKLSGPPKCGHGTEEEDK